MTHFGCKNRWLYVTGGHMSLILALWRQRWIDLCKFQVSQDSLHSDTLKINQSIKTAVTIPNLWHSRKGKILEIRKLSMVAKGFGEKEGWINEKKSLKTNILEGWRDTSEVRIHSALSEHLSLVPSNQVRPQEPKRWWFRAVDLDSISSTYMVDSHVISVSRPEGVGSNGTWVTDDSELQCGTKNRKLDPL